MNKQYLISLHKKRSIIALIADVVMLICSIYSIFGGIVDYASKQITGELLRYLTIL